MKLSKHTLDILKNFSNYSPAMAFKKGMPVKVVTPARDVIAIANVSDELPDFAIYEMGKFLSVLSTFKEPELEFEDKFVTISSSGASVSYHYAAEGLIEYFEKNPALKDAKHSFELKEDQLAQILQVSSLLKHNEFQFLVDCGECIVRAVTADSRSVDETNAFSLKIGEAPDDIKLSCSVKIDNMKFMPGDYRISLFVNDAGKGLAHFKHAAIDLSYYLSFSAAR